MAASAQHAVKFGAQRPKIANLAVNLGQMDTRDAIDRRAGLRLVVRQRQQFAHRLQREPQFAGAADERQAGEMLAAISAVVGGSARAALVKSLFMLGFGGWVFISAITGFAEGTSPDPGLMGAIGALALAANVGVALMLYRYRTGDANMRSVWICSRNDAVGNVAVLTAALGVFGTGSAWPDLVVASIMAALALTGGVQVFRQAMAELQTTSAGMGQS